MPRVRWENARDEGIRLIEQRDFAGAVTRLGEAASGDPSGESEALLGLAHYHAERYDDAAAHYAKALEADGDQADWSLMEALSKANATAEVDVAVPPVQYFDREDLLSSPESPRLPKPPKRGPRLGIWRRVRHVLGHALGSVGGVAFELLTRTFGKNYRGEVWTNWYRKRLYTGILTLAYMREKLNRDNLKSTYPAGTRIGFQPDGLARPEGVTHFRTADGSWNNLDDPKEGAAGTRFPRNVDNTAIKPANDAELMSPNPREVSRKLLTRGEQMKQVPFLNLLAASWIQFQNHDWITHGENLATRDHRDPARRRRSGAHQVSPDEHVRRSYPARPDAAGVGRGDPGDVHQRGDPLVGRLADLRQRPGDPGPAAQRRRRQAAARRRRPRCRSPATASRTPA